MPTSLWRTLDLDRGDHGVRVDRVLLRHLRDERAISRNRIQKWIDAGDVLVNGTPPSRAAWRVQAGDEVRVRIEYLQPRTRPAAQAMDLDVLYEDGDLLALNKPAGLVVHPSYKNTGGTLMNGVLERAKAWPDGSRPGLLGRLDKDTSGVVVVAKRPAVHAALQRAMDARRIEKDYAAIVWGRPSPQRGTIDLALDRDPWDRRRITVTDRGGQPSVTKYERLTVTPSTVGTLGTSGPPPLAGPLASFGEVPPKRPAAAKADTFSLVRCRLITGRTHQIRVHLSARGWPIVGDAVYGRKRKGAELTPLDELAYAFPRQALHAWRLSLRHPMTGAALEIVAPLPEDMQRLAAALCLPTVALA
ncbi:MAG: RluA family pseudouridine synthase [Acidobacteriota bacterium]|nr:RluA family pseudouridine synthase [Acidobacteriota bacterium]